MARVNPHIRRWLDDGRALEAILGAGDYHVPSYDYVGEHDRILVMNQLLTWATDRGREADAARAIEAAVRTAASNGDAAAVYYILWSYFIIAEDRDTTIPLDRRRLAATLSLVGEATDVPPELLDRVTVRVQHLPSVDQEAGLPQ